jgi:hypothetical protein
MVTPGDEIGRSSGNQPVGTAQRRPVMTCAGHKFPVCTVAVCPEGNLAGHGLHRAHPRLSRRDQGRLGRGAARG